MYQLKQISNMKKILILLSTIFLLNGCAESLALLGTGTSNGKIVQSSLNSAISYGVKKQIKSKSTDMMEKTTKIAKEYPKKIVKEISKIEKIAKKSVIYNRR